MTNLHIHVISTPISADSRGASPAAPRSGALPDFAALFGDLTGSALSLDDAPVGALALAADSGAEADKAEDAAPTAPAADLPEQLFASLGLAMIPATPAPGSGARPDAARDAAAASPRVPAARGAARAEPARPDARSLPDAEAAVETPYGSPAQPGTPAQPTAGSASAAIPDNGTATAAAPAAPAAGSAQETRPATEARPAATVPGQVGSQPWREALGSSVLLFATQRVQSAELRLQPPELGPVQVSIRIEAGEASVTLVAAHAETRQALESALPRLREMLEAGGLSVGQASVGDPGAFHREHARHANHARPGDAQDAVASEPSTPARAGARAEQLVDVFA